MTLQRIPDLVTAYASGFTAPTQQEDLVRSGVRRESLRKLFAALPEEIKDGTTRLWDWSVFVNKDMMVGYHQKYLDSRPYLSVSFSGSSGITIRGRAWPLRKDGTFNIEAVVAFLLAVHWDCALQRWGATGIR